VSNVLLLINYARKIIDWLEHI